jgi:hypothetical protein
MESVLTRRWSRIGVLAAATVAFGGLTMGTSYAADEATIFVVQGIPGQNLDVEVDGKSVADSVKTAAVAGPFTVKAGSRKITFSDGGDIVAESTFSVKAKSSTDLVVHLPAAAEEDPVVTVFRNDLDSVPKNKARLVVAHTAVVPPADIRVNGDVLFENIANGESLKLTVPVATYKVAIVPTGESKPVVLGPLSLTVKGGAVNRVYAIGDPGKKTMNVAVHVIPTASSGSDEPDDVNTGFGGQAVGVTPVVLPSLIR